MKGIVTNGILSPDEQSHYVECILRMYPSVELNEISLDVCEDRIQYRIAVKRQILVKQGGVAIGDPLVWNDAKRAEYRETIPNSILDLL